MALNLTKPQKLLSAGKIAEAAATLPPPGQSTDPRAEIIRSRIHVANSQPEVAAQTLRDLTVSRPDYAPGHLFLGIALWDLAKYSDAQSAFDRVLQIQKSNDLARSYSALCRLALHDHQAAAEIWRQHGFSDNAMYRVRIAEYVESQWLYDQSFMGELAEPTDDRPKQASVRKALRHFYRRDFVAMLDHFPQAPSENELEAFLAATSHEMLRHYTHAQSYIDHLLPRRSEWPDPLVALNARLMVRHGEIANAAREFASVIVMGPEDFGVNYYMGIVCLAYERREQARQYFLRAFTDYMVDTLEFQWWQLEQTLLNPSPVPSEPGTTAPAP